MRRAPLLVFFFCAAVPVFFCAAAPDWAARPAAPQQPDSYYLYNGAALQVVRGDPARAPYKKWQVWLYPQSLSASQYGGAALAHARWGVIQGSSARAVIEQLAAWQKFERTYADLFGPNAWGRLTFSYAVEPIAVAEGEAAEPSDLRSEIDSLNSRLGSLVAALRPSLENSASATAASSLQGYFDQVHKCLQDAARFYDQLGRLSAQRAYLSQELARLGAAVSQAEGAVPEVRAALPTVKLPASNNWMTHAEEQGNEGTVEVKVVEVGSAAWVQQSWSGGDGSMAGTIVVTILPYQDIGSLDVWVAPSSGNHGWTVRIGSASRNGFPQSMSSPERKVATRTYAAVDLKTTDRNIYLEFRNPSDAQDAFTFFLYHKERGR